MAAQLAQLLASGAVIKLNRTKVVVRSTFATNATGNNFAIGRNCNHSSFEFGDFFTHQWVPDDRNIVRASDCDRVAAGNWKSTPQVANVLVHKRSLRRHL